MILSVSYTKVEELYVQNPAFGFYFLGSPAPGCSRTSATLEQRLAQQTTPHRRAEARLKAGRSNVASFLSSLRYLLADLIGEDDAAAAIPARRAARGVAPVVSEGIHLLIDYQGTSYAQLYVDRLRRFVGRADVDDGDARRNRPADGDAHEL